MIGLYGLTLETFFVDSSDAGTGAVPTLTWNLPPSESILDVNGNESPALFSLLLAKSLNTPW